MSYVQPLKKNIFKYSVIYQIPEDVNEELFTRFLDSVLHYTNDIEDAKSFIYKYTEKNSHIKLTILDLQEYTFIDYTIEKLKVGEKYSETNKKRTLNKSTNKIKFNKK